MLITKRYEDIKVEMFDELHRILEYWASYSIDAKYNGFVGRRDFYNNLIPNANKGIILNSRILWSFSSASIFLNTKQYMSLCDRAFQYLKSYFKDELNGGVFWEVHFDGSPSNTRKQVYAQSFVIYALSEYYKLTKNEEAKLWAIDLFEILEKYARDRINLGYYEAFNEDWSPIMDMRLSEKDLNCAKSMNTHLHLLEAYTNLYQVYKAEYLKKALEELIYLFQNKFLEKSYHHTLFYNEHWAPLSQKISYGHDIEAAWLMIEAAKEINDRTMLKEVENNSHKIISKFMDEALDRAGAVMNEYNTTTKTWDADRHWWPQVEALIGLKYGYELVGTSEYLEKSIKIWEFIKGNLLDYRNGEWHFRVDTTGQVCLDEDKISMWKAPYHSVRACIKMNQISQ